MRYAIEVTERDIAGGNPGSTDSCPIARAIARALGVANPDMIAVDDDEIVVRHQGRNARTMRRLPRELSRFIERFDEGKSVPPMRFSMTIGRRGGNR
jgi:hypothetical protein